MAISIFGSDRQDWITRVVYRRNGKVYRKKIGCRPDMTHDAAQRAAINLRVNSMTQRIRGSVAEILEVKTIRRHQL